MTNRHVDPRRPNGDDRSADDGHSHRDLLTPQQLADWWGISVGHLANLRHQGDGIGYLKIGSRVAYRFTDLLAYEVDHYISTR